MAEDYILDMTWRDEGTAVVHAVAYDVKALVPVSLRRQILRERPRRLRFTRNFGVATVCNEVLPDHGILLRDEQVTCEACLSADGWPAVDEAVRLLHDAARSLAVWP